MILPQGYSTTRVRTLPLRAEYNASLRFARRYGVGAAVVAAHAGKWPKLAAWVYEHYAPDAVALRAKKRKRFMRRTRSRYGKRNESALCAALPIEVLT